MNFVHTNAFASIIKTETQLMHYQKNNATAEVVRLVAMESKPFGSVCEKIIGEILSLGPRMSTQNDASYKGKKIEIKTARYWSGKNDCKWQHIEKDHDYDYVLFALLGYTGFNIWGTSKESLFKHEGTLLKKQGKQGYWVKKSDIAGYCTLITSKEDLDVALGV